MQNNQSNSSLTRPLPVLTNVELVSGGWANKYLLTYTMPNGSLYQYESVSRKKPDAYRRELEHNAAGLPPVPDAVCIVPQLPDGSVLLIREFRYPLNSWCISFPAGLIEAGEDLAAAVDRELREETGYRLIAKEGNPEPLSQSGFSSTGLSEENVQVMFAQVEPAGDAQPEESEFIESFLLASNEIRAFLDSNTTPIGTRCQLILEMLAARA